MFTKGTARKTNSYIKLRILNQNTVMSEFSELRIRIRMIGIFFQSAVFTIGVASMLPFIGLELALTKHEM